MANRLNYYFRQKVTEAELDLGFTYLEEADRDFVTDHALIGVVNGMVVTERGAGANLSVDVSAGRAYDKNGARISFGTTQNVDVSVDEGSASTAVVGVGNSKIISVFAKFVRNLTDPRTDGNSLTVYFDEAESFQFVVRQGAEALSPAPPPLDGTFILLADITRAFGQTTIVNANIDTAVGSRREDMLVRTGATFNLRRGRIKDAFSDVLDYLNTNDANLSTHLNDATDAHDATAISFLAAQSAWADATDLVATDVQAAIDEIVTDLAAAGGAAKVGATGNGAGYVFGTSGTSVQAQLDELSDYLDEGPLGRRVWSYVDADSPVTITTQRQIVTATSGGGITFNLPAPSNGREIWFKDATGTWGTSPIQLVRNGSEKIENVAADRYFYADYGSFRLFSDGTDWFIG